MAELVGQHQQSSFTNPQNATTGDADQVRQNDNDLRSVLNAHDADGGLHLQSGLHASRPAASVQGRKWLSTDTMRLYYDTGSTWVELNYLVLASPGVITGPLAITDALTVQAGGLTVTDGNVAVSSGQVNITRANAGDSGTSKTLDWNDGNLQRLRLTGNVTLTLNNPVTGASYFLELLQDATGGRTVTWPSTVKWEGGSAPTLTTTANRKDCVVLFWNGSNYLATLYGLNFNETT